MRVIGHFLGRLHRDERGSVLLFVVGFLPVAFAAAAFVIDMGNSGEHRRHLQLQADAGALAAAQEFNGCFLDEDTANAGIEAAALSYSGVDHNAQVGGDDPQDRVVARINATAYDATSYSLGDPCDVGFVDVKLTEKDSPPVFAFVGNHDFHGRARVKIFKLRSSNRMLPIAVPDPDPRVAIAKFVNESTGAELASTTLSRNGSANGLALWDAAPVDVPITAEHVGLRILLSGDPSATNCTQPLTNCYDLTSGKGLVHLRGWTAATTPAATATAPIARSVSLTGGGSGGCPDPTFVNAAVSCTIGVDATIDFGNTSTGAPITNPVTTLGATVSATVDGQPYPLTFSGGTWSTTATIPVAPLSGPHDVGLHWQITKRADGSTCNGGQCRGDLDDVHRTFSAKPDNSGPIGLAQVTEGGALTNSFQRCSTVPLVTSCTHSLKVTIGLSGGLELSTAGGPPVRLRVTVGQASQTQSLDCDPDTANLRDELANGCNPSYRPHETTDPACPDAPSALWARPNPPAWDCVAVEPGDKTNQVAQGLNLRIFGTTQPDSCSSPNHWPNWRDYPGDPRIILVMVTPFGSLAGNGNSTTVPVVRFAAFYITGWTGNGSGANPCIGQGDEAPADTAEIVGRFIQYVEIPNNGGADEETCDFSAIDPCTAVLVD
jgi:Putative Flp pilus-assembly TadE/G-like